MYKNVSSVYIFSSSRFPSVFLSYCPSFILIFVKKTFGWDQIDWNADLTKHSFKSLIENYFIKSSWIFSTVYLLPFNMFCSASIFFMQSAEMHLQLLQIFKIYFSPNSLNSILYRTTYITFQIEICYFDPIFVLQMYKQLHLNFLWFHFKLFNFMSNDVYSIYFLCQFGLNVQFYIFYTFYTSYII